ncbi:MAG: hypothetical protein WAW39_20860 [Prosthecobacter sp.]|uniref:hypothetical protein n=1 Tax=Prosthecobacter sp. TaxID=1965333 RepID=UPI003BB08644
MDTRTPHYIYLKRSLDYPRGSLSPRSTPEPRCRREARQDAQECSSSMVWLFLGFIVLTLAIYHHHDALLHLLGF